MSQTALTDVLKHLRRVFAAKAASADSDSQLVKRFVASQDEAAFAVLVQRHGPLVLGVCQRLLGDAHAAEDAFQATFVVLSRRAGSIRKTESVASWLYGVAQRIARDAKRRTTAPCGFKGQVMDQQHADPLDELTWQELRGVLDEEIARLPEKCRAPIVLCYLEGRSYDEAAKELGWPKSSLASRLSRGRELLRQQLTRRGIGLSSAALATVLSEKALGAPVAAFLTINTVKAATSLAASQAVAVGCLSEQAIVLAEEAMKGMLGIKAKLVFLGLTLGLAVGGAGLAGQYVITDQAARGTAPVAKSALQLPPAKVAQPNPMVAAVDLNGDPLPEGAVARIGNTRFWNGFGGGTSPIAYTPDGKELISIDADMAVVFWDAATGKKVRRIEVKGDHIYSFALSPDGKAIATVSAEDPNIRLWEVATGKEIHRISFMPLRTENFAEGPPSATFTPDGKSFAAWKMEGIIRLWDTANWKELPPLLKDGDPKLQDRRSRCYQFLPDGKTLISANDRIRWLDIATGKEIRRSEVNLRPPTGWALAVSPDGKRLAALAQPDLLFLWNAVTGEEISRIMLGSKGNHCLCFSPDSQTLACNIVAADASSRFESRDTILFAAQTGKELNRWRQDGLVYYMAYSPDGKTLAQLGRVVIDLRDAITGKPALELARLPDLVLSLGFASDSSKSLTIGCRDGAVSSWDSLTGKQVGQYKNPPADATPQKYFLYATSFTADGKNAALVDAKGVLHVWEPLTGKTLCRIEGMQTEGEFAVFSPDGKLFAIRDKKRMLGVWDTAAGKLLYTLPTRSIARQVFSDDGRWLATATTSFDGVADETAIRVWDTATGKLKSQLAFEDGTPVAQLVFSAEGMYLVSIHHHLNSLEEPTPVSVRLWDLAGSRELNHFFTPDASRWGGGRAVLSPDAKTIAVPSERGVILWELATGQERGRFTGHHASVLALAFSPEGRRLASGSNDYTALVWDLTGISPGGKWITRDLAAAETSRLWAGLAGADGTSAYRAIWKLTAAPTQAAPFLKEHLLIKPADPQQLAKLLADLDSNTFATRQKATQTLESLGEAAEEALRQLLKNNPPLEVRQRVEQILEKRTPDVIRNLRAIEAVEQMGTPEARQLLETLAKEAPNPRVAEAAAAALQRLAKRTSSTP